MIFGDYDYETDIAVQREEALAKGLEQGARENAEHTALNALNKNLEPELIAEITGISLERVKELAEGINVSC